MKSVRAHTQAKHKTPLTVAIFDYRVPNKIVLNIVFQILFDIYIAIFRNIVLKICCGINKIVLK